MLEKVRQTIIKHHLFHKNSRIIVGFSGGIDSVCLLHILKNLREYKLRLWALYVNYGLRPEENKREEAFLEKLAMEWQVIPKIVRVDLRGQLQHKKQSLQIAARELRYQIFEEYCQEIGGDYIALGHHQNDQAETVFYRLLRGSGIDGLAGIPISRNQKVIRPLLEISRFQIEEYVKSNNLVWLEDSSNTKKIYNRNKIRHDLIPFIEANFNPKFQESLNRIALLAAEQKDFMKKQMDVYKEKDVFFNQGECRVGIAFFLQLHNYEQYYLLKEITAGLETTLSLENTALLDLRTRINSENYQFTSACLREKIKVFRENHTLIFLKKIKTKNQAKDSETYPLKVPGVTQITSIGCSIKVEAADLPIDWKNISEREAYLDLKEAVFPLKVRFWQKGDAFKPLGIQGVQKLQDFFVNQKISKRQRHKIPLVVDAQEQIIWVGGYRINDDFKISQNKKNIWHFVLN